MDSFDRYRRGDSIDDYQKMKLYLLLFLVLIFSFSTFGQTKKFVATVRVQVISDNESLKNQMFSYIARELRDFNDVSLVNDATTFTNYSLIVSSQKLLIIPAKTRS